MNGTRTVARPRPRRRVLAVPSDVAHPESDGEITLEAFRALMIELTGRDVPSFAEMSPQADLAAVPPRR